jgi:hypothetical protein
MKFAFLACLLIFFACSSDDRKVIQDDTVSRLRIHFEKRIKAVDSTNKLDSFRLINIDSLTQRDKYNFLNDDIKDSLTRTKLRMEVYSELYKASLKLANVARGRSNSQYSAYKADAEENKKEFEKYQEESKLLELQSKYYDSLLQKCDTVKAICYEAVCLYQLRRKDQSVLKDTVQILMNLDRNIIRREDYLKLPD